MTEIKTENFEIVDWLVKASRLIYLATEASVADDIKPKLLIAAAEIEVLRGLVKQALDVLDGYADPTSYTDVYGEPLPADAKHHEGELAKATAASIRAALSTPTTQP